MEYDDAVFLIEKSKAHVVKRTGRRKLKNKTYLVRRSENDHLGNPAPHAYELYLFDKCIIEYRTDTIRLDDHNFFSWSTHDRFNEYLPRGFRVSGMTARFLKRPVGFIRTPKGTYPYRMPTSFTYDGYMRPSFTANAPAVFGKIPSYVEHYLTHLLKGSNDLKISYAGWAPEQSGRSLVLAEQIINGSYYKRLAYEAVNTAGPSGETATIEGVTLEELVLTLEKHGAKAFKKLPTGPCMENLIQYGKLPIINETKLRKWLRPFIVDHLVAALGFDEVEWNRR